MSKRPPYARIAITLPQEDLEAADALARDQDRSRSWIVAEAVRHYVTSQHAVAPSGEVRSSSREIGDSRLLQLRRDLALTPEQRVLLADETLRNVPGPSTPQGPRSFDRYEDFLDWKLLRAIRR